jgi:hypothetical protein
MTLAILLCALPPNASARDREFSAVVQAVENTYHARQNYRFVTWFAGVATKVARPEGVNYLRMALFADQSFFPRRNDANFEGAIASALAKDWQPLVRVWSKRDSERTHIYARENGNEVNLIIITVEDNEAVVMEVKMSARKFAEKMNEPARLGCSLRENRKEENQGVTPEEIAARPPALEHRGSSATENP